MKHLASQKKGEMEQRAQELAAIPLLEPIYMSSLGGCKRLKLPLQLKKKMYTP
jgi:hypothetical protein